ncbi:MAG: hypothetical protein LQ342_001331 [Letrouitia transgressa]|nr:MAG: hypothetical protein LQ342_001331 [Letrouitia transgressa]
MSKGDFGGYKRIMQYFWDPEPRNEDPSGAEIWCLGRQYTLNYSTIKGIGFASGQVSNGQDIGANGRTSNFIDVEHENSHARNTEEPDYAATQESNIEESGGWPTEFLDDFESRFWFTYRSNFPPIPRSDDPQASASISLAVRLRSQFLHQGGFTSDTGWGYWRRGQQQLEERQLLALFADDPEAPFSIHRFVEHGASACGKHPGEWFGPSATARCIQALSKAYAASGLEVYINGDGADVYEDKLKSLATTRAGIFTPTLILVGIRLGIDRVTPAYRKALKSSLQLPQSIGIAGGRPSSSLYFVGIQDDNFFYLDPHQTRQCLPWHVNAGEYSEEEVSSCHSRRLRRLSIDDMDPSMLIAFLIRDMDDWKTWREAITKIPGKPIIHIADKEPNMHIQGAEKENAIDDVEIFDENEDDNAM